MMSNVTIISVAIILILISSTMIYFFLQNKFETDKQIANAYRQAQNATKLVEDDKKLENSNTSWWQQAYGYSPWYGSNIPYAATYSSPYYSGPHYGGNWNTPAYEHSSNKWRGYRGRGRGRGGRGGRGGHGRGGRGRGGRGRGGP